MDDRKVYVTRQYRESGTMTQRIMVRGPCLVLRNAARFPSAHEPRPTVHDHPHELPATCV